LLAIVSSRPYSQKNHHRAAPDPRCNRSRPCSDPATDAIRVWSPIAGRCARTCRSTGRDRRDNNLDPGEVASLLFYPTAGKWIEGDKFTADFETAYDAILAASTAKPVDPSTDEGKRQKLVGEDLDQGRATLVHSDLKAMSAEDKAFLDHMLRVATLVDQIYEEHNGAAALAPKLPADPASHSLFRRNRGPKCVAPATEKDPLCSAIPLAGRCSGSSGRAAKDEKFWSVEHPKAKTARAVRRRAARPISDGGAVHQPADAGDRERAHCAVTASDPKEEALVAYLRRGAGLHDQQLGARRRGVGEKTPTTPWSCASPRRDVLGAMPAEGRSSDASPINQGSKDWQAVCARSRRWRRSRSAPQAAPGGDVPPADFIDIVVNAATTAIRSARRSGRACRTGARSRTKAAAAPSR
jgi:hypothetical protein